MTLEPSDPAAFHALHAHNESRWQRLQEKHRNGGQQAAPAAPAPNAQRPRMPNGKIDRDLESTRAVYQMFNQALSKKGGR